MSEIDYKLLMQELTDQNISAIVKLLLEAEKERLEQKVYMPLKQAHPELKKTLESFKETEDISEIVYDKITNIEIARGVATDIGELSDKLDADLGIESGSHKNTQNAAIYLRYICSANEKDTLATAQDYLRMAKAVEIFASEMIITPAELVRNQGLMDEVMRRVFQTREMAEESIKRVLNSDLKALEIVLTLTSYHGSPGRPPLKEFKQVQEAILAYKKMELNRIYH